MLRQNLTLMTLVKRRTVRIPYSHVGARAKPTRARSKPPGPPKRPYRDPWGGDDDQKGNRWSFNLFRWLCDFARALAILCLLAGGVWIVHKRVSDLFTLTKNEAVTWALSHRPVH